MNPTFSPASSPAQRLQQLLGVRPDEVRTVGLFFVHNFLLGIGTILIYVSANTILLENNPEANLPVAYIASALAMMGVGRLYTHYEHHLILSRLAGRVLVAVVVMTFVVGLLVYFGHSAVSAVAIMAGYRLIYLLTNLEFWGVSAVVFDTRQSKRLFSVISSGDMPAKAMGAILAALIHAHTDILLLLVIAFGSFLAAFYTLQLTIESHEVHATHRPGRVARREEHRVVNRLFGGSRLVLFMCLSLSTIAAVATTIEYDFFINVKHRFHAQADVIRTVSYILALTYGVAMLVKGLLTGHALDRFGVRRSLVVLPLTALVGVAGVVVLRLLGAAEAPRLIFFSGVYLLFEVVRRSLFDPVFLVLFQPLSPQQRLQGHTLAKGFYEPFGIGLAGLLLYAMYWLPDLETVMPLIWMALLGGAIWLLQQTYHQYVAELNEAIGRRFLEGTQLAMPSEALGQVMDRLRSTNAGDVMLAISWLEQNDPAALGRQAADVFKHPLPTVRYRMLEAAANLNSSVSAGLLRRQALAETDPALRERAAYLAGRLADINDFNDLMHHSDLHIRQGFLQGLLEIHPQHPGALAELTSLTKSAKTAEKHTALAVIRTVRRPAFVPFVRESLASADPVLLRAALQTAGYLRDADLHRDLIRRLDRAGQGRTTVESLKTVGEPLLPLLAKAIEESVSRTGISRIADVCGSIHTLASRHLLTTLAQRPDLVVRLAALRALSNFPLHPADSPIFRQLVGHELILLRRLLHGGLMTEDAQLTATLDFERTTLLQRLFYLLAQIHDPDTIASVRTGIFHPSRERRANALERLDNLISRPVYQTMQALVDESITPGERVRLVDVALGQYQRPEPILTYMIEAGETVFSDWSVSVALRRWTPALCSPDLVVGYADHDSPLVRDAAVAALQTFRAQQPIRYHDLIHRFPSVDALLMSHLPNDHQIPAIDVVMALKATRLFAQTPENVLSSIVPIIREVSFTAGQPIFNQGDLGTSMFVIHTGEVGIYEHDRLLARFGPGDFFGELALLDTEARSATATVLTDARLLRIDQDDFYDLMEERAEILRSIVQTLCQRIRQQNALLTSTSTPANTPG